MARRSIFPSARVPAPQSNKQIERRTDVSKCTLLLRPPAAAAMHLINEEQMKLKSDSGRADLFTHCPGGWKAMKIHKGMRILSSMLLMGALAAPLALQAQDRDDHHDRDDHKNQRVYDRDHKDYHNWNGDEDRNYRQWYSTRYNGREYRDYNRINHKDQSAYWGWRHQHGDDHHDNDHHDNDRR
jgi:hypothetical protein